MQQHTIKSPLQFKGIGLHTGKEVTLDLLPAPIHTGYRIRRSDLEGEPEIPAVAEMVSSTTRATLLQRGEFSVCTIEHCLSSLYALGVDNCILVVNGPEFPILDGSAAPYVKAIVEGGIEAQKAEREYFVVKKPMEVYDEETGSRILMIPDENYVVETHLEFESPALSNQRAVWREGDDYGREIAPARSFVFLREILMLAKQGLIKGGDTSNALIIKDKELSDEDLKAFRELFPQYNESLELGFVNPSEQFGLDEPARHKILDILGDFALTGRFLKGRVIAFRPGHSINNRMARLLRKEIKLYETQAPLYNPDQEPLMDINRIRELLPHRFPFLLVDKIIEVGYDSIVGVKSVSGNEPFFEGHFPEEPVMPGVLIVEAMAQTGGLLVLNAVADGDKWSTYFLKIENAKFRYKVVPGDTLVFKLRLMSEIRRGIANMRGLAFVGNRLVCEAEFTAQITKTE